MSASPEARESVALRESQTLEAEIARLHEELSALRDDRERAECMASIQRDAVQLALDLLVTHPDLRGFFRMFIKRLVDESEAHACGVWLLDEGTGACNLWMAYIRGELFTPESAGWASLDLPRESMGRHLAASEEGRAAILEYEGDDERLPEPVRAFNRAGGVTVLQVAPLRLAPKTLGWIALTSVGDSECERLWRHALLDATAKQATLALYYTRQVEQSLLEARRQAVLEERNRIARDIHDTLAQGFGAILMQLQAAQRGGVSNLPPAATRSLETAIDLARTHLIEARRSVAALRPQSAEREDVATALGRMVDLAQRTGDVPVELAIDELPAFDAGVEREIIGIAQEALTNAVRHARARRIVVRAGAVRGVGFRLSVADDGRGIAGDRSSPGFGMTSMRERADRIGASLTFVTAARSGTEVVLAWQPAAFSIPGLAMSTADARLIPAEPVARHARVLVVDDHSLLRTGVANIINHEPDLEVIAEAANGRDAIEAFLRHRPDVVLMDLRMPEMEGVEAVRRIRDIDPQARVVVLTTYDADEDIARALQAGAKAYILKDISADALVACVRDVLAGKTYLAPAAAAKLAERVTQVQLTPRELAALRLMANGHSNKEIATALEISERTVKSHLAHLFEKLQVTSRTEAVRVATRRGLVRFD